MKASHSAKLNVYSFVVDESGVQNASEKISSTTVIKTTSTLQEELSERIAMELSYRYLSIDYQSSGFVYDIVTKGPSIGVQIEL